jgi:hypothetical protein
MKNVILLFVCSLFLQISFAQLNCKTTTDAANGAVKKCLHANKKVSTEEIWDEAKRFGTLKLFNNQGVELAVYHLREVGGHASAHLTYHSNGQVAKVEFSDAPDGGTQFFESTRKFDENGKQVEYNEMKYPYELETTFIQIEPQEQPQQQVVTPKKEAFIPCATIYQTFYQLQNTTSSKIVLTIQPIVNNVVNVTEKEITLKPNESIVFDTILMADQFITAKVYQPSIKQVLTKKRNEKKIKIIEPGPIDAGTSRTYYWFIVE